ncbi:MAG: HAMP domain-containing sensor histidine kinase [Cyanobacteria bacterium P01_E01_bin.34]
MAISVSATVAVVGATSGFATWTMYREIFSSTKVQQQDTLTRLFQDVDTYQEMLEPAEALERGGDKYSDLDTWVQVADRQGNVLFQSEMLDQQESFASFAPPSPELVRQNGQSWIVCGQWLTMNDGSEVFITVIDDITPSDRAYWGFIRTLSISGFVAVTAATGIGMALIRRSLSPLRKLSRVTDTISIDSLEESRLSLMDAPEEVEQLVVALNQMIDRLAGAWETEQQLLGDISHELRTPLAIVQGYLETTLRRGQNLNEMQRESLTTALDETQGTVRLLQEMMNLARAESCGRKVAADAIEMGEFACELEGLASQIVSNPFEIELPEVSVHAVACRHRLRQVMLNLITNAGRYSDSDSPIVLRVSTSDTDVTLDVQDSGIGIAPEQLPRIFDRFYRADGSRNRAKGGVGLGLSIASVLMEQMHGSISVDSKVGEGSTFTLHLPKASPQPSNTEIKQSATASLPPLSRV